MNFKAPPGFYDWEQHMAEEGFLVLASRCRTQEEVEIIRQILSKTFKKQLPEDIFYLNSPCLALKAELEIVKSISCDLALTKATTRIMTLLLHAFR